MSEVGNTAPGTGSTVSPPTPGSGIGGIGTLPPGAGFGGPPQEGSVPASPTPPEGFTHAFRRWLHRRFGGGDD